MTQGNSTDKMICLITLNEIWPQTGCNRLGQWKVIGIFEEFGSFNGMRLDSLSASISAMFPV